MRKRELGRKMTPEETEETEETEIKQYTLTAVIL